MIAGIAPDYDQTQRLVAQLFWHSFTVLQTRGHLCCLPFFSWGFVIRSICWKFAARRGSLCH